MTVTTPTDIINDNFRAAKRDIQTLRGQTGRNIGELIYSSIPLTDASLHLLDGSVIAGNGVYASFVSYIASLYNASGNPYASCFTTEANWQTSISTYGVCGKFVYTAASGNNPATVRLPKIIGVVEGTINAAQVGNIVEASLPSTITSSNYFMVASSDSTTIEDPDQVQPQTTKLMVYIVMATSVKTQIQVDIDNVATELNTLSAQVSDIGISNYIVPVQGSSVTIGNSGATYSAPADGYFHFKGMATSGVKGYAEMSIGNNFNIIRNSNGNNDYMDFTIHAFVKKGQQMTLYYKNLKDDKVLKFFYTEKSRTS